MTSACSSSVLNNFLNQASAPNAAIELSEVLKPDIGFGDRTSNLRLERSPSVRLALAGKGCSNPAVTSAHFSIFRLWNILF